MPSNPLTKAIDVVRRHMQRKNCLLYQGNVYRKIPESTCTYAFYKTPESYLMGSLSNPNVSNNVTMYVFPITKLLSNSSCRIIENIKIDFNFIEVNDGWFFDIENKTFVHDAKPKGSPRAFVMYDYTGEVPKPRPFIEGTILFE